MKSPNAFIYREGQAKQPILPFPSAWRTCKQTKCLSEDNFEACCTKVTDHTDLSAAT